MDRNELETVLIDLNCALDTIENLISDLTTTSSCDELNRVNAIVRITKQYAHNATEALIDER